MRDYFSPAARGRAQLSITSGAGSLRVHFPFFAYFTPVSTTYVACLRQFIHQFVSSSFTFPPHFEPSSLLLVRVRVSIYVIVPTSAGSSYLESTSLFLFTHQLSSITFHLTRRTDPCICKPSLANLSPLFSERNSNLESIKEGLGRKIGEGSGGAELASWKRIHSLLGRAGRQSVKDNAAIRRGMTLKASLVRALGRV